MAGGRNYVKKSDSNKSYGHPTSLCWSCARAYALPDPAGCGWHRREHEQVWDAAATKYTKNASQRDYPVHSVIACRHYVKDAPRIIEKDISDFFKSDAGNIIIDIERSNNKPIDIVEELVLFKEWLQDRGRVPGPMRVAPVPAGSRT